MKIVKPSHQHLTNDCTPYEMIEKIGRTCYKSTDKITEGSAKKFVEGLISRNHWAMLEHFTVYLSFTGYENYKELLDTCYFIKKNLKFINITETGRQFYVVSGNLRSFYDIFDTVDKVFRSIWANIYDELVFRFPEVYSSIDLIRVNRAEHVEVKYYERQEFIDVFQDHPDILLNHLTHTVMFTCDRGVSHELVRHRPCSFAQESTRYCNYSKEKFGKEITVIKPFFYAEDSEQYNYWKLSVKAAEDYYFKLIESGSTPQEARSVLPNSLKTEIIMTATESEWQHICNLRAKGTTGAPHPQMKEIMSPWFEELQKITDGRIQ